MDIMKLPMGDRRYELFVHKEKQGFKMCFGGSDFYWVLEDYYENNEFFISKEDGELYSQLKKLFRKIEKNDDKYRPTLKNGVFEWVSEARQPEESNKLIITSLEKGFSIRFIRNPLDIYSFGMCAICFCLSGSRNQNIASAFCMMYKEYDDKPMGVNLQVQKKITKK